MGETQVVDDTASPVLFKEREKVLVFQQDLYQVASVETARPQVYALYEMEGLRFYWSFGRPRLK